MNESEPGRNVIPRRAAPKDPDTPEDHGPPVSGATGSFGSPRLRRGSLRMTVAAIMTLSASAYATSADAPPALVQEYKARCRELMPQMLKKGVHKVIFGPDGWLLLRDELEYAASDRFWGIAGLARKPNVPIERADAVAAIAAFRDELARHGIELLFAPAPTRAIVVPEAVLGKEGIPVAGTVERLQPVEAEFFAELRARGVAALDLTPVFLAHRAWEHAPLYVPSDPHWTGAGVALAAGEMAAWIKQRAWYPAIPKQRFEASWKTVEHFGPLYEDLFEHAGMERRPPDTVQCRPVKRVAPGGALVKVEQRNPDGPVILIGDSHTVWFRSHEASLFQELAFELGFAVDSLSTSGGGTNESRLNLVRTAASTPGYLTGKKLVIWCFSTRYLLGHKDGWLRIQLDSVPGAGKPPKTESKGAAARP